MAVRGNREVARALRELSQQVSVPLNATSRFALQPTLKAARTKLLSLDLDDSTGTLASSLTIKRKPSSKLKPVYQVGPDASKSAMVGIGLQKKRRPVRYAHLLEFGTAPHYQPGRGVVHPGSRAKPFLTPAFHETKGEVVKRFGQKIGPEMEKRAAKLNARAAKR